MGWLEETVAQVKKLASAQARQTGEDRSEAIRHLYQKLSVLLTRGNAALLLNSQPSFPDQSMMYTNLIHTYCRSESSNYQLGRIRHRSSLIALPNSWMFMFHHAAWHGCMDILNIFS
jgi:hypothetical protein